VDLRHDLAEPDALDALTQAIRGGGRGLEQEQTGTISPYQGLRPFGEESAAFFSGREAFSQKILEAVFRRKLVAVVGPSGSGKSSIVQAGVVPLLRRQKPPSETWDVATFVPGDRPFQQLSAALMPLLSPELGEADLAAETQKLARLMGDGEVPLHAVVERILLKSEGTDRLLLVADQFEELFTLCSESEAQAFLRRLLDAVDRSSLSVVLTLRGVFYDRLISADRELSDRLEQGTVNLGPMTREELQRAIVEPARKTGLNFEPGLAKRLLDDVGSEPGNLPLLEFALTELWVRREQRLLTHKAYEEIGGVTGAVAGRAEAVFESFDPSQQEAAKRLLLRLVWVGSTADMAAQEARQRLPLAELEANEQDVVGTLCDARLLVLDHLGEAGGQTVEVAHEALIRKWTRLRDWLDEDREFLLWRRRLNTAREYWINDREDDSVLLRGNVLREAESWQARRPRDLGLEESRFIAASASAGQRARAAHQRRQRRLFGAAIGTVLVLSVLAAVAVMKTLAAVSQELAAHARAQLEVDPERSVLLAREAVKLHFTGEADDILRLALQELQLVYRESFEDFPAFPVFANDGKTLIAVFGNQRQVRTWTWDDKALTESSTARRLPSHLNSLEFSPDGNRVAVAATDAGGKVIELSSGHTVAEFQGYDGPLLTVAFSKNDGGKRILGAGSDGFVRLWDAESGQQIRTLEGRQDRLAGAVLSPDGERAVTFGNGPVAVLWNVRDGKPLRSLDGAHTGSVQCAAISGDGKFLATGSGDTLVAIWDVATGRHLATLKGHRDSVVALAFNPRNSGLLVSAGRGGMARLWKHLAVSETWQPVTELKGHSKALTGVAFDPDGHRIVTTSRDWTLRVWDAGNEHSQHALLGHLGSVDDVAFAPNGRLAISASGDNTARVWDLASGTATRVLSGHVDSLTSAVFGPAGNLALTASVDGTARIWDVTSGDLLHELEGHRDFVDMAAFDPSGRFAVTASEDATARLWDVRSGTTAKILGGQGSRTAPQEPPEAPTAVSSPDERFLASRETDGTVRIRDLSTGAIAAELAQVEEGATVLAVSSGADALISADDQGRGRLWQRAGEGWQNRDLQLGRPGRITAAAFSPDGRHAALAVTGAGVTIANLVSDSAAGPDLKPEKPVAAVRFSADGLSLLTTGYDHEVGVWKSADGSLLGRFCAGCKSLPGHGERVWTARFSPDGKELLTASRDGTARIWDLRSGRVLDVLEGHLSSVMDAVFSPDGQRILTVSRDRTARLWKRDGYGGAFSPALILAGHEDELINGAFSPDGTLVATASRDFTGRVWDAASGELRFTLKHQGWVNSVDFSPDGKLLVSASRDGTAAVWDLAAGSLKLRLRGHRDAVNRARFDPSGATVATASQDGSLRVWNLLDIEQGRDCRICRDSDEAICRWAHQRVPRSLTPEEKEQFHVPEFTRLLSFRCPS
ncbi:MAG: hypothetical protein FIA97_01815, partial [Methylococcaceae bacterium]|nr:hypothetical protein [Methylococcaceae bacterium]